MLRVGFEPMIPAFERAKTVHALDRAATVFGVPLVYPYIFFCNILDFLEKRLLQAICMLHVTVIYIYLGLATNFLLWLAHLFCISPVLFPDLFLLGAISVRRPSL
jgi:hypothetical protein